MFIRVTMFCSIMLMLCSATSVAAHDDEHDAAVETTRSTARVLPPPRSDEVFHFVIYGDRTGGVPAGLKVLEQAVDDTQLLDPDLVMTVGDLIQGYNESDEWLQQMREYKAIMNDLPMPWYPVAGNHDVYWRGEGPAPPGQHEQNYEKHFGPLWYSFRHKNAGFIVLYSDEGDSATNEKGFNRGNLQRMSDAQLEFLDAALKQLSDVDHVFAFLHHPRWIGGGYTGGNWDVVHEKLKQAGNVSAVFAGHIHHMRYDGPKDGIQYFTLATTGGNLSADIPGAGYLHHLNLVTVRSDRISVAAIPVGAVIDPRDFTESFLQEIALARSVRPVHTGSELVLQPDGSVAGTITLTLKNPCPQTVEATVSQHWPVAGSDWTSTLDHEHFSLAAGTTQQFTVDFRRPAADIEQATIPSIRTQLDYVGPSSRIALPDAITPVRMKPGAVPADYFSVDQQRCLLVQEPKAGVRIDSTAFALPDGPMTLETWVRPINSEGYNAMIAKTQGSEFALFSDEGVPQFDIHLNGRYVTAAAQEKLPTDKWTHLAGVFDGNHVSLYVNGTCVSHVAGNGTRGTNTLPLFLGADPDSRGNPTRSFTGWLDEVRLSAAAVYDTDFSPQRRLAPAAETVLLFHLDRGFGPFQLDHSTTAAIGIRGDAARLVPLP